jgi:hypothetical protein
LLNDLEKAGIIREKGQEADRDWVVQAKLLTDAFVRARQEGGPFNAVQDLLQESGLEESRQPDAVVPIELLVQTVEVCGTPGEFDTGSRQSNHRNVHLFAGDSRAA